MSMLSIERCRRVIAGVTPVGALLAASVVVAAPPPPPEIPVKFEPAENNDDCVPNGAFDSSRVVEVVGSNCVINGKLEKRFVPDVQPDTWLCVFDKQDNLIAENDNRDGDGKGNPWASAIWSEDGDDDDSVADILVANGDGTYSLRLVVTGFPDGLDGNCNGFFQNAPHGQLGEWEVCIWFGERTGDPDISYRDEFIEGSEAFRINFTAPATDTVHVEIDNTVGRKLVRNDRDFFCLTGFAPQEEVFLTVVGGIDMNCNPTDTQLCWFDKDCNVIASDDNSGPVEGYSQLFAIADVNGNICIGVSGGGDANCDGALDVVPAGSSTGDDSDDSDDEFVEHGKDGDYTIAVDRAGGAGPEGGEAEMIQATSGDLNLDGGVDGRDLGIMLVNWGMIF